MFILNKIEIIIADDHPAIRAGIRMLIRKIHEIVVVGEASSGSEAVRLVREFQPDLLLLDINMPEMNGVEVLNHLRAIGDKTIILALSAIDDPVMIRIMLEEGVAQYLLKEEAPEKLLQAILDLSSHKEPGVIPADQIKKKNGSAALIFEDKRLIQ